MFCVDISFLSSRFVFVAHVPITNVRVIVKKSSPKNLSADCRPTGFPQNIDYQSADSRPTVGDVSVRCR